MDTSDEISSSDEDSDILPGSITQYYRKLNKRKANWEKEFGIKKRRYYQSPPSNSSHEESPSTSSSRSSIYDSHISPEEKEEDSQNSVSDSDDDILKFLNNPRLYALKLMGKPPDYKRLLLSCARSKSNDKHLLSNNRSEKDPVITDTSPSNLSNKLKSPRNLQQSFRVVHETDNLPDQIKLNHEQDEPNSADNSDASSTEKSSSKPSYVFHDLFWTDSNEEFSCEWKIFHSHLPMDVLTEEQFHLRNIKNAFKKALKSKGSINQTEALNIHQALDKDESQNLVDQDIEGCFDWDKFLDKWEGERIMSDSTLEAQHHEKTKEDDEVCPPANSTSTGAKKCLAKSPKKIERFKSSSLAEELEMIIHPVPLDVFEPNIELEKVIKNSKMELPEDYQIPPFLNNFASPDTADFSMITNGLQSHDLDLYTVPLNLKGITNSFKKNFIFD